MLGINTDSIKRFGLFSVIGLRHYWWYYMFVSIGIVLVISAITYFYLIAQPSMVSGFLNWAFWFFLNIGVANISTSAFSVYAKKSERIHLLTIPVSNTIRLVATIVNTIIIPFIIIAIIFTLLANFIAFICSSNDFTDPFHFSPFASNGLFTSNSWGVNLAFYMVFQSILLMIGSFFPKAGTIKTVLCVLAFLLIVFIVDALLASYSFDKSVFFNIFDMLMSSQPTVKELLWQMPGWFFAGIYTIGTLIVPFSFYIVYLRLKEMEV